MSSETLEELRGLAAHLLERIAALQTEQPPKLLTGLYAKRSGRGKPGDCGAE